MPLPRLVPRRPARTAWLPFLLVWSLLLAGCRPEIPAPPRESRPRLVVLVVYDQLGSWVLEHHWPYLPPDGALARAAREGFYARSSYYDYAGTVTAAGHSVIATGADPYQNGVGVNRRYDRARQKAVSIVDDGDSPLVNDRARFASPALLRVEGVADVLKEATQGRGKVLSVSMKDRGAVLPAGKSPDLALWFDKSIPGFTTSQYYALTLPRWVADWNLQNPLSARLTPWEPLDPARYAAELGPDDAPGEGDWDGFGKTFPHDASKTKNPYSLALMTPQSSEWLLDLAAAGAKQLALGQDEYPDLLIISISGTDIVGHVLGAESWESVDHLARTDAALGRLLDQLNAEHGPIAAVITADHGVAPLPERNPTPGRRVEIREVIATVEDTFDKALGPGQWVVAFQHPFITLSLEARRSPRYRELLHASRDALQALPGMALALDVRDAPALRKGKDPLAAAAARSVPPGIDADLLVVPAENSLIGDDEGEGSGTTHGSFWRYDQRVPVLAWGAGVPTRDVSRNVSQRQVASTLAYLLGVRPPTYALPHFF